MSDTEDYPGPTKNQPDKKGQDPRDRADEKMVKPPARPQTETKKVVRPNQIRRPLQ
jgi:hypothetical protein